MDLATARRRARRPVRSSVRPGDYFSFEGGLNEADPPLRVAPGQALAALNYEPGIRGGYRRVGGYERFDGQLKPSAAAYYLLKYRYGNKHPSVNDIIDGQTSGADGKALAVAPDTSFGDPEVFDASVFVVANNVANSEDLSAGAWTKVRSSVSSDAAGGPFESGARLADALVEDNSAGTHYARTEAVAAIASDKLTFSCYCKLSDRTEARIIISGPTPTFTHLAWVQIDLIDGSILASLGDAAYVYDAGSGWYRLVIELTAPASQDYHGNVHLGVAGNISYTGNGSSEILVAGAQFEVNGTGLQGGSYARTQGSVVGNASGSLALGNAAGRNVDYTADEQLRVSGDPSDFAAANGDETENGENDDDLSDAYRKLAEADARAEILEVPGEGGILGTVQYGASAYAFRNKVGGATAGFYKSTPTGWVEVTLDRKIRFDAGTAELNEGATLTGVTSGATATIKRVGTTDADWAGGNATGWIIIGPVTGGPFQNNEALTDNGATPGAAVADGADFAQTLAPGGKYEFRIQNFFGHTNTRRLYGVSGTGPAFEYDSGSDTFACIDTGMVDDRPAFIGVHNRHLILGFPGGSLQNSGLGLPLSWSVVTGANENAIGQEITGFIEEIGDEMFVYARNKTFRFVGTSIADFQLLDYSTETGGFACTMQRIGQGIVLDDRGFTSLAATDRYGNYAANSFSNQVQKTVSELKSLAISSVISRRNNLYRCFLSDGQFFSIGVRGTAITGIMLCDYGRPVRCITSEEDATGRETVLFGSDDGYVYEADIGRNFDGEEIEHFMRLVFHHSGSPDRNKRYRRGQVDVETEGKASLSMSVDFSFANPDASKQPTKDLALQGGGGFWDVSKWDQFKWNTGVVSNASIKIEGSGTNIGLHFYGTSDDELPHTLFGVTFHLSMRRLERGVTV